MSNVRHREPVSMNGLVTSVEFWLSAGICVFAYEAYAIVLVWRSASYTRAQQAMQVGLVVLLPLLGAVIAHWFAAHGVTRLPQTDREFEPREVDGA